jgi:hypothetical protein
VRGTRNLPFAAKFHDLVRRTAIDLAGFDQTEAEAGQSLEPAFGFSPSRAFVF